MNEKEARSQILSLVADYCREFHNKKEAFKEGDRIPYASRVYNEDEMVNLVDSAWSSGLTSAATQTNLRQS